MKVALAQINPVIADIPGNTKKIIEYIKRAYKEGAELVVFSELTVIGYPPMDLLEFPKLIDDSMKAVDEIASHALDIAAVVGFVYRDGQAFYNSAAFCHNGKVQYIQHKTLLPTYDVFDEGRYFTPAEDSMVFSFHDRKIGITICEDIWDRDLGDVGHYMEGKRYSASPVNRLAELGCDLIVNLSASPFVNGKFKMRIDMLGETARRVHADVIYVNQVGGNDSLVFDGYSLTMNRQGELIALAEGFKEDLSICHVEEDEPLASPQINDVEEMYNALVLGLRDYTQKCGFTQAVLGLSGGIDSALTATIAAHAMGSENVLGITMPSHYSSSGSVDDSKSLTENLGIGYEIIPIKSLYDQYIEDLHPLFKNLKEDTTEENIQARIRGNLLMAVSNKTGRILLTTGNKSELAMGYCTLYGDMAGGLAVISDLPKTVVYEMSKFINQDKEIIPWNTITKPPSAELRPDQKDEDSLPPYEILDDILEKYIEQKYSAQDIIDRGADAEMVHWVLKTVNRNEYKRIQAPPGLKVTGKAFGTGRRIPLAQKFIP
jgi:NAD+ synthase (glutamine-hydrolysing)